MVTMKTTDGAKRDFDTAKCCGICRSFNAGASA